MATAKDKTVAAPPTIEDLQKLSYVDIISQTGDALLKSIEETQEQFLAAAKQVAESLPKAPEFPLPIEGVNEVQVPTARELFDVTFSFADKLMASQKAYADKYFALTGV
jgi:hypothetical protein